MALNSGSASQKPNTLATELWQYLTKSINTKKLTESSDAVS